MDTSGTTRRGGNYLNLSSVNDANATSGSQGGRPCNLPQRSTSVEGEQCDAGVNSGRQIKAGTVLGVPSKRAMSGCKFTVKRFRVGNTSRFRVRCRSEAGDNPVGTRLEKGKPLPVTSYEYDNEEEAREAAGKLQQYHDEHESRRRPSKRRRRSQPTNQGDWLSDDPGHLPVGGQGTD